MEGTVTMRHPPSTPVSPASPGTASRERGLTLIELIVTVIVIGILAGIGFPAFQEFSQSATARRGVDDLATGFMSARTLAVTNGVAIKICAVTGGACSGSASDWSSAWAVFEDCDGDDVIDDDASSVACTPANSNVTANGPERVYARGDSNDANWTVTDDNNATGPTIFTFRPSGRVFSSTSDWPVTFAVHGSASAKSNLLIVSRLGQVCVEIKESGECG